MVDEPAESWYEALIVRMKAAREQAGYTQREVAKILNTSINTVSRWEIGATRAISITHLTALAALYLVSVGWLIGEEPAADEEERAVLAAMRKLIHAIRKTGRHSSRQTCDANVSWEAQSEHRHFLVTFSRTHPFTRLLHANDN